MHSFIGNVHVGSSKKNKKLDNKDFCKKKNNTIFSGKSMLRKWISELGIPLLSLTQMKQLALNLSHGLRCLNKMCFISGLFISRQKASIYKRRKPTEHEK